ncbi:MAG: pilus assembly protein [Chloroflexi bacterium]|nr:pilus assembly protein [Chloroflexota bacterium]
MGRELAAAGAEASIQQPRQMVVRISRGSPGQSLVEFALVMPVFLTLIFGVFDFGRYAYAQAVLDNAVREGARHGMMQPTHTNNAASADPDNVAFKVTAAAKVLGLGANNVRVQCAAASNNFATPAACTSGVNTAIGDQVVVTILGSDGADGFQFRPLVSYVIGSVGVEIRLRARSAMVIS